MDDPVPLMYAATVKLIDDLIKNEFTIIRL